MRAKESTGLFESTLNGLLARIVVVDDTGEIVFTNKAYRMFAEHNGIEPALVSENVNYLAVCDSAEGRDAEIAHAFAKGLRDVLAGSQPSFELEYPCHSPDEQRWFRVHVTLSAGEGPRLAILAHEDITKRKLAQIALEERVKEIRCIADIMAATLGNESMESVLQLAAENLSLAMQYPDIACARIFYEGQSYQTKNFRETEWRLVSDNQVQNKPAVVAEVFYLEERVAMGEGPFLTEEQTLINIIVDKLTSYVEDLASKATLKETKQRLETLAKESHTITWETDTAGLYTFISTVVEDVLGYRQEEIVGKLHFYELHPEEGREAFKEQILKGIQRGEAFVNLDNRLVSKDGSFVWVMTSAYPILNADGSLRGYRGTDRDITKRKLAEDTLRLQAQRSEVLLELPRLADDYDEKRFMQRALDLAEDLTGSKISFINLINEGDEEIELVAWSRRTLEHYCTAAYDSHYPVSKAGIWADALREGKPVIYNDYPGYPHKKDLPEGHSTLQRLISVPVIENGRVVMLAGVGNKDTDYTDLDSESVQLMADSIWQIVAKARSAEATRSAEVAREASARLENLAVHIPGVLYQFQLRPDGTSLVPYASSGIQAIYGVTLEQVIDDATGIFEAVHPDDIAQFNESIQESARTLSIWKNQHRVNLPDGRTIWVEGQSKPEAKPDGSVLWHGYNWDITESKNTLAALLQRTEQLKASQEQLKNMFSGAIDILIKVVEARDPYTAGHEDNVAKLSGAIAEEMGMSEYRVEGLVLAAKIHDVGKVSVPADILTKPTRLNKPEFELIKMHPQTGYDIVKEIKFPWPIAEMVYQHHERMDGSGYPRGLKGEEILLEARIMCVADVVEAMTSHRPYRPGLGIEIALAEIENNRGLLYDPAVVDTCLRLFREGGFKIEAKQKF